MKILLSLSETHTVLCKPVSNNNPQLVDSQKNYHCNNSSIVDEMTIGGK